LTLETTRGPGKYYLREDGARKLAAEPERQAIPLV
jgi:hypothetical protein